MFEAIKGSTGTQSQPVRLTDLGVDPALVGLLTLPHEIDEEISDSTRQWGWASLGLAALALTTVALWALPDRRRRARVEKPRLSQVDLAETPLLRPVKTVNSEEARSDDV